MMRSWPFVTVDVFTERRFGGNPLAVFPDAGGLTAAQMQALAAELNLSETTFVLPPEDPRHTARLRIFNPKEEMPFAGHPNVGTAFVLAQAGRGGNGTLLFEEIAGIVPVELNRDAGGSVVGATVAAPQVLEVGRKVPVSDVAACVGLAPQDVLTARHEPVFASMGYPFLMAEASPAALARAAPDVAEFRRARQAWAGIDGRLSVYLHTGDGPRLRARMFAPLVGLHEDPATGSAAATLVALLLSLGSGENDVAEVVVQGVEMGRPSLMRASACRTAHGIRARVGGSCVPVFRGEALL